MERTDKKKKKYSAEFKISVILDMRETGLSYRETVRKYEIGDPNIGGTRLMIQRWERIYLEEGAAGLMKERRGRTTKADNYNVGRPKKELSNVTANDLIAENQRLKERLEYLEMENEYLKKLEALVRAEEQKNGRRPK